MFEKTIKKVYELSDLPLPESVEGEKILLGSLIGAENPDDFATVADLLTEDDFFLEKHKFIYRAMRKQYEGGYGLSSVSIFERLREDRADQAAGGLSYLASISSARLVDVEGQCKLLLKKTAYRKAMAMATDLLVQCSQQTEEPIALLAEAQRLVQVFGDTQNDGLHTFGEVVERAGGFEEFCSGRPTAGSVVPWIYQSLETTMGGLHGSELILLAARPGIGKSASAMQQAVYAASRGIRTSCYVMEMSDQEVLRRCVSSASNISASRWRLGGLDANDRASIAGAAHGLIALDDNLLITEESSVTPAKIATDLRRWKNKGLPIQFVVVDYLQLMAGNGRFVNREQEVSSISRGLKLIAQEFKIPVLALCQIRREADDRADRRPELRDLRESGSLEQNANVVIFEWWPKPNPEEKVSDINWSVAKQRNGPLNEGVFQFNKRFFRFEDPFGMAEMRIAA